MMKILEQKGALASEKMDRVHKYVSMISRHDYEVGSLRHLAENVFQGDPSAMVVRLISESKISKEELQNIRKLLDERIRK
jgi:predicted transcriptional regulator